MSKDWQIVYAAVTVAMIVETLLFGCLYFTNPFRPVQGVLRARAGRRFFDVRADIRLLMLKSLTDCCPVCMSIRPCVLIFLLPGVEEDAADDGPQNDADLLLHFHSHGAQLPGLRQKVQNLVSCIPFPR